MFITSSGRRTLSEAYVLLTGPIPDLFAKSPIFFLRGSVDNSGAIRISNWFIVSHKGNPIIQKMKYLLECYWQREHRLKDYFIFHILLSCLIDSDEECRAIWDDMFFADNLHAHRMQSVLFSQYSDKLFNEICLGSPIHKLTNKFKDPSLVYKPGTVYEHLMKG